MSMIRQGLAVWDDQRSGDENGFPGALSGQAVMVGDKVVDGLLEIHVLARLE